MKVYLIDAGGSTLDILAVCATRELADALIADWRKNKDTRDDGWDVREWDVLESMPVVRDEWEAWTYLSEDGSVEIRPRWAVRNRLYPWQQDYAPATVAGLYGGNPLHFWIWAKSNESEDDAFKLLNARVVLARKLLKRKREISLKTFAKRLAAITKGEPNGKQE